MIATEVSSHDDSIAKIVTAISALSSDIFQNIVFVKILKCSIRKFPKNITSKNRFIKIYNGALHFYKKKAAEPRNICRNEFDMEMKGGEHRNI
jgi:hypothetical protein